MNKHCNAEDTLVLRCLLRIEKIKILVQAGQKVNVHITWESPRCSLNILNYWTSLF